MEQCEILIREGIEEVKEIQDIVKLYNKVIPNHIRDENYYYWLNKTVYPKTIISLCKFRDKVIGHYAIHLCDLMISGKVFKAGYCTQAVIDHEYSEIFSIFELTKKAINFCREKQVEILIGFPNNNYCLVQEKIEKWKKVNSFKSYVVSLRKKQDLNVIKSVQLISENEILNLLESNVYKKNNRLISFDRDKFYFRNRYFSNPLNKYNFYKLSSDEEDLGFFITKVFNNQKIHLIDFSFKEKQINFIDVFNSFYENASEYEKEINCWIPHNSMKDIKKDYVLKESFATNLMIKVLKENTSLNLKDLLDYQLWDLKMGDSDAF